MKRDWEIIREILLKAEALEPGKTLRPESFEENSIQTIAYHLSLMQEAGLVHCTVIEISGGIHFELYRLTWEGHEFLDSTRDDTVWRNIKSTILSKSSNMSFDIIKTVASEMFKSLVLGN